jgi:methyl-accepting chemotaxis protein
VFDWLRRQLGVTRLVDDLVDAGSVAAIRILDSGQTTLTYNVASGKSLDSDLSEQDLNRVRGVVDQAAATSYLDQDMLKVAFPIVTRDAGTTIGAVLVLLPTDHLAVALRDQLRSAGVVAVLFLGFGILASMLLSRRVTKPVATLTAAAAAIESDTFELGDLSEITQRSDELGQLARVFDRMAREVYSREQRLRQQVESLRVVIDQAARQREVAAITETDYFQELEQRATELRAGASAPPSSSPA